MNVEGMDKDGAAVTRNIPVLTGGVDGSGNVQTILVDTSGRVQLAAGSIDIGSVDQGSPGATPWLVQAALQTGVIYSGTTALTPVSTFANVAASQTDSNVVTATAAKIIRVLACVIQCGGTATTVVFNSRTGAGAGAAISMTFQNAANGGAVLPFNRLGWFDTVAGDILSVTTGAGSTTGIQVVYVKV